jgi:hypothetical protein
MHLLLVWHPDASCFSHELYYAARACNEPVQLKELSFSCSVAVASAVASALALCCTQHRHARCCNGMDTRNTKGSSPLRQHHTLST